VSPTTILVDPGVPPAEMAAALGERAGIAAADVDNYLLNAWSDRLCASNPGVPL
jgi:hypothetical protein